MHERSNLPCAISLVISASPSSGPKSKSCPNPTGAGFGAARSTKTDMAPSRSGPSLSGRTAMPTSWRMDQSQRAWSCATTALEVTIRRACARITCGLVRTPITLPIAMPRDERRLGIAPDPGSIPSDARAAIGTERTRNQKASCVAINTPRACIQSGWREGTATACGFTPSACPAPKPTGWQSSTGRPFAPYGRPISQAACRRQRSPSSSASTKPQCRASFSTRHGASSIALRQLTVIVKMPLAFQITARSVLDSVWSPPVST